MQPATSARHPSVSRNFFYRNGKTAIPDAITSTQCKRHGDKKLSKIQYVLAKRENYFKK